MRSVYTAAVAAALLAAPVLASAQPGFPTYFGPVTTYAARGCGDQLADRNHPFIADAVCLDGTITVGRIEPFNPAAEFTTALAYYDFGVTRAASFTPGTFYFNDDAAYFSSQGFFDGARLVLKHSDAISSDPAAPLPVPIGMYEFAFRYPDTRFDGITGLFVSVRLTETPEPATLALTLGGLAVFGAGAWRRRA